MEKKYFPIKTDTSCQLKWAWSTIHLPLGTTASCHRVTNHLFDIDTFNFHNTSQKIAQRQSMLNGVWPDIDTTDDPISLGFTTCQDYCGKIEENNSGQSDREFFLQVPNLSPKELDANPTAVIVSPTILEVYIDNICNLGCIYCVPELSSRLDFEQKKYGSFNKNGLVIESKFTKHPKYESIEKNFWKWMENNSDNLVRLHLLGGEPFYQRQFIDFLTFFESNPRPNLEFNITTNLMLSTEKLQKYIEDIKLLVMNKKVKRLDITASIDCWGPQQEFVRYGLDLNQWEKNFEYLIDQKWITLNINNVVSILTIKTLPDLLVKLNKWNKNRKIEHYFSQLYFPSYLAPDILGLREFQKDFDKILLLMKTESWRGSQAKKYMQGIVSTITDAKFNQVEILKLITFLDETDRRRNTNWKDLFPWLIKYEDLCGIQE